MKKKKVIMQYQTKALQKGNFDLFIKEGTILNVYSGELLKANIGIKGERIWYVGPFSDMAGEETHIIIMKTRCWYPATLIPTFIRGIFTTLFHSAKRPADWEQLRWYVTICLFYADGS
ncbi:MAG: hypothetical protein JXA35_02155 [Deltaproteobacteria bacterium]|nr:hypothetical protein [Deltaproteobacteria bacterium]